MNVIFIRNLGFLADIDSMVTENRCKSNFALILRETGTYK